MAHSKLDDLVVNMLNMNEISVGIKQIIIDSERYFHTSKISVSESFITFQMG